MHFLDTEKAQAVLFFGGEGVSKELLFPELEALLDGFVPIGEWAGSSQKAVYVEFTSDFIVTAAVFFIMNFDDSGAVEATWNLPLVDMARTATKGPDLGAGAIHLVCRSQCPVAYFKDWLWDPDMRPQSSHFSQIKKCLKRNRLGLHFKVTATQEDAGGGKMSANEAKKLEQRLSQQFSSQYEQEMRNQMAQLLKDQRLRVATMSSEKDAAIKELRLEQVKKIESLQQLLEDKVAIIEDLTKRNGELKNTIDGQVQKIEGLREYFEHKLQRAQGADDGYVDSLVAQHEKELAENSQKVTQELNDVLKMKEIELLYRTEHEAELRDEIQKLRQENQELLNNSGDHLLEKLSRKGVNFVTYQPGAGHITIPYTEIPNFVGNPSAFTAAYCGVSEKHYQAWLKHYQTPVCCVVDSDGDMCSENLKRVINPEEFVVGESDVCEAHRPSVK